MAQRPTDTGKLDGSFGDGSSFTGHGGSLERAEGLVCAVVPNINGPNPDTVVGLMDELSAANVAFLCRW